MSVNIPTAIPLVYEYDAEFNVLGHSYLMDTRTLKKKQASVADRGKFPPPVNEVVPDLCPGVKIGNFGTKRK